MTATGPRVRWEVLAAARSPDLLLVLRAAEDDDRCLFASAASLPLLGLPPSSVEGRSFTALVHEQDREVLRSALQGARRGRTVTVAARLRGHDGTPRWTEVSLAPRTRAHGGAVLVVAVRDVSSRQLAPGPSDAVAGTDSLTGLVDRRVFHDRTRHALDRLGRTTSRVGLLFLDLDHFKLVNDTLGHAAGDEVLVAVAQRLQGHLRPSDTLARLGGDEFGVLAEDLSGEQEALALAARLTEASRAPYAVAGEEVTCTVSTGLAVTADPRATVEALVQAADLAMYRAKERGRDRAEAFDDRLRALAQQRLVTERLLRGALAESRLRLQFQPIVDVEQGTLVGAEALVRIALPGAELLLPGAFLQVARECGLLRVIDDWVLAQALQQAAAWRADAPSPIPVSLNITGRHLADARFPDQLLEGLHAAGLAPSDVHLELTEDVLARAPRHAAASLARLRRTGVQVGLDDFGAGASSLACLRELPLDYVKVDRSFVARLETDAAARATVAAIVGVGHAVGLSVVAEGVETPAQQELLSELRCEQAQGFLYGPSAGTEGLLAYARAHGTA